MMSAVDGHSWALCAIEEEPAPKMVTALNKDLVPLTASPVVVQQHNIPPSKFVLLSAKVQTLSSPSDHQLCGVCVCVCGICMFI